MVDEAVTKIRKSIPCSIFIVDGMYLWIPVNGDCNIAYMQEMTEEEVEEFGIRIDEMRAKLSEARSKLVKPRLRGFSTKIN